MDFAYREVVIQAIICTEVHWWRENAGFFFARNPPKSTRAKFCGNEFWPFGNEFWHFGNEF